MARAGFSQSKMYKTEGERQLRESLDWIPDTLLNGSLLIDRFPESTPIRSYDGIKSDSILDLINWWRIYASVYCGQKSENLFSHPDSVMKRIYLKDTEKIFELEEYSAALIMINVDYSTLIDDSTELGNYSYSNNRVRYNGTDFAAAIHDHYSFAAGISYNGPNDGTLKLRIEQDNFFTNRTDIVRTIDLDINNGQQVFSGLTFGSEILLTGLNDSNIVRVTLNLRNGNRVHCNATLNFVGSEDRSLAKSSAPDPDDLHSFTDYMYGLKYKVAVWYGCNSYGSITKPFLVCNGFSPEFLFGFAGWEWGDINPSSPKSAYKRFNNAYLLDELRGKGYDIIMVMSKDGMIETDGLSYIFEDAIKWVNQWNPTGFENVALGISQGAVALRMALSRMEKKFLNNQGPYHRTKLYLSWEGEHRGVNVPIGSQAAVKRIKDNFWIAGFWENNLNHWFNSVVIKEYAIYKDNTTYSTMNQTPTIPPVVAPIPGYMTERQNLISQLYSYDHPFTEVSGYPSFVRRVGISNGSYYKNTFSLPSRLALFMRLGGVGSIFQKSILGTYDSYHDTGDKVIYEDKYRESVFYIPVHTEEFRHIGSFPTFNDKVDQHPGSVFAFDFFGNGIHRITCDKLGNSTTYPSMSICADNIQDFVPTYSALDIQPASTYFSSADYNMINANLMYSDYPNISNNEYGYPHIGLGASAGNATPFDALYANQYNDHHVLNSTGDLKNFILWGEIQPYSLTLQNRVVGEHLSTYSADFEAENAIWIGENVTVIEPVGKFEISQGTSSVIRAGNEINLTPGTLVDYGSSTLIHIGYIGCPTSGGGRYQANNSDEERADYEEVDLISISGEDEILTIMPNPTTGRSQVKLNCGEENCNGTIRVVSLTGVEVDKIVLNGNRLVQIDLTDEQKGLYLIIFESQDKKVTKRLVKL